MSALAEARRDQPEAARTTPVPSVLGFSTSYEDARVDHHARPGTRRVRSITHVIRLHQERLWDRQVKRLAGSQMMRVRILLTVLSSRGCLQGSVSVWIWSRFQVCGQHIRLWALFGNSRPWIEMRVFTA